MELFLIIFDFNTVSLDWHAAGKGPDPVQAKLDREMDEYQKGRTTAAPTV